MADRYDVVVYGASGFTGAYIVRAIATSSIFKGKTLAVAGRSEAKLRATLDEVASDIGVAAVSHYPIIIADSSDEQSLAAMAKRARVIINAVGPYRLHGEAVVKAAVENGESHLDLSGEPAMGFDPVRSRHGLPQAANLWNVQEKQLEGWALPFLGSDKSIVQRSQYYDYHANGRSPVQIATYFSLASYFWSFLVAVFASLCMYAPTRKLLQAYPDLCSFHMFKNSGPTKQQMLEASFAYFFYGRGWAQGANMDELKPEKRASAVCRGPDPGYISTSACVVSAALAVLDDKEQLPAQGGVYTTASAFRNTRIFEYLKTFGITFEMQS
uniref:Sacchrp_dh_NADP domain-containing protein n=1 Tax=Pristionchus pacificus TaxID=54126 RepID=A0A8R1Y8Y1_PRIPA